MAGWIGVDLDGTLAFYDKYSALKVGAPIEKMVLRVKYWLSQDIEVRIVTARVFPIGIAFEESGIEEYEDYLTRVQQAINEKTAIEQWCLKQFGTTLKIQCFKDYKMYELWDDRAIQILPNTGDRADGKGKVQDDNIWKMFGPLVENES